MATGEKEPQPSVRTQQTQYHQSLARGLMHMHTLAALCGHHRTGPSGVGPKWSQYGGLPVTIYIYCDWRQRIVATLVARMAETQR